MTQGIIPIAVGVARPSTEHVPDPVDEQAFAVLRIPGFAEELDRRVERTSAKSRQSDPSTHS